MICFIFLSKHEPFVKIQRKVRWLFCLNVPPSFRVCSKVQVCRIEGVIWLFFIFFVCDTQILLPEGIHRENNKMYEQVEIPPNEAMPIGFEEKPIYISELDEVGAAVYLCLLLCVCVFVYLVSVCVCSYIRVRRILVLKNSNYVSDVRRWV